MLNVILSPAEVAAQAALKKMYAYIDKGKNFRFEAGAGAGKTYSLVEALKYIIAKRGSRLLRNYQQVACISYTNVASDEIASRIHNHKSIYSSTIHSFCWSFIKGFQHELRKEIITIDYWREKITETGGVGSRYIGYDEFGHRSMDEKHISLHHNDVLPLFVKLMEKKKFRLLLSNRYPILLVDEYQDTDKKLADALVQYYIANKEEVLIGFFGDHWQKIYGDGCGVIKHSSLEVIGKESNFRSVPVIIKSLNKMRPELPQNETDPQAKGSLAVYHTNDWQGTRRTGAYWAGDLPEDVSHKCVESLKTHLAGEGWDFAPDKSKILMLTHNVLAAKQGYANLARVFPYNDAFIKKENAHIKFFVDVLELACTAYENKRYGEMFKALGRRASRILSHSHKIEWINEMDKLLEFRAQKSIGDVIDYLRSTKKLSLPDAIENKAKELEKIDANKSSEIEESSSIAILRELRKVQYQEIVALTQFIEGCTPFSTKHGVKGAEFDNVLAVFGRGWNQYNFNQFLEWSQDKQNIPDNKISSFERNRNLFYVCCSRPKIRLAVLFTQELSDNAMNTLVDWFGEPAIHPFL